MLTLQALVPLFDLLQFTFRFQLFHQGTLQLAPDFVVVHLSIAQFTVYASAA